MSWYPIAIPSQAGRRVLVTGANSGLGFFTSARLAQAGAHVVMSGRSQQRLDAATRAIRERIPSASLETQVMDQASLASVHAGVDALLDQPTFDVIVANAGMVHPPTHREVSVDGNELVMATNVLGHFVLFARLVPTLEPAARIVSLGSLSSRLSTFRTDDLQLEHNYRSWRAYAHSKIATQSIGFELDRRLRLADSAVSSIVVQPGYSTSGLTPRVTGVNEPRRSQRCGDRLAGFASQGKHRGAEVAVFAATSPLVQGGQYWGPANLVTGKPSLQQPTATSIDASIAATVWAFAEAATGEAFSDPGQGVGGADRHSS